MCLAIPVQVEEIGELSMAKCRVGESETHIDVCLMMLEGQVEIGDWVIVHAGFGIRKLDPVEAEESLNVLRQMAQHHFDEEALF